MIEKKLTDNVFVEQYSCGHGIDDVDLICHYCDGQEGVQKSKQMLLRDNEDGPMYWCIGCGYTLDEGVAMMVRLNEVNI